jgi:RNA polymerase sigma-70 factor (ECF subfamily)
MQHPGPVKTDEELLAAACTASDDRAFHELIDRHAVRLLRLAFKLVGNVWDAEDVVQETLIGAYQQMGKFRGQASVKTWLTRILVRQAARCHRRRSRGETVSLDHVRSAGGPEWQDKGSGDVSEEVGRRMDVLRALRRLSPQHREVVVLREYEGMSYAEIAETLDVPQGTVESRLYRARQELKAALQPYLPPGTGRGGT